MKKIGITGNIGSGKSTTAKIFALLGVPVYDADSRAKAVMVDNQQLVSAIKKLIGTEAYFSDGKLNRAFISSKVFQNESLLAGLNALVHPAVFADFDSWCAKQNAPYVLKEAALLIESGYNKNLDQIIVVAANEELRLARCLERDHAKEEDVLARMRNQMPQEEKLLLADYIIQNNNDLLIPQVMKIHQLLIQ